MTLSNAQVLVELEEERAITPSMKSFKQLRARGSIKVLQRQNTMDADLVAKLNQTFMSKDKDGKITGMLNYTFDPSVYWGGVGKLVGTPEPLTRGPQVPVRLQCAVRH